MNRLSTSTILPPPHRNLQSPRLQRSPEFSKNLDEFRQNPEALNEDELATLVEDCMSNGDDDALRCVLPHVRKLEIIRTCAADERAWWTLLSAMSEPSRITEFIVEGIPFNNNTASLFLEAASRMRGLHHLSVVNCHWNLALGDLTCPALPKLESFFVAGTTNSLSLLALILDVAVSQPSDVRVSSNPGMKDEDHAALAKLLFAQAKAKLSHLSLRRLLATDYDNEDLDLRDRTLANVLGHYTGLLKDKRTTLERLDLGSNPLGPESLTLLHGAFGASTAPVALSLDKCWGGWRHNHDLWRCIGELVQLQRFVGISLCGNAFPQLADALFDGLAKNEGLQQLDLRNTAMPESIWSYLATCLKTTKLTTLYLPEGDDKHYGLLLEPMETNEWLRTLQVPAIEQQRLWLSPAEFDKMHEHYLKLQACVHRNWLNWQGSVEGVKNGMAQVLAHMGSLPGQGPRNEVPGDIAGYLGWWSLQMNGAQTRAVSALNKDALPKD